MRKITPPFQLPDKQKIDAPSEIDLNSDNPNVKKYTEKYRLAKEHAVDEARNKIANEKRLKRRKFFLKLGDAAIGAIVMLFFEHIVDIIRFVHYAFSILFKSTGK